MSMEEVVEEGEMENEDEEDSDLGLSIYFPLGGGSASPGLPHE